MATAAAIAAPLTEPPRGRQFLGHPFGLGVLTLSELWERFSYTGMQTLLVLYATHYLFQPAHVGAIWGIGPFRAVMEGMYGPLSPAALASAVFGLYAGLVYLTPILGGLLADRLIGKTRAITLGALLLTAGHFLMGYEQTFLIALLALVLGVGAFKTNITGQVGDLYAPNDLRRARGFQIFVMGISTAAMLAPLVCGTLGEKVGWAWGFGVAGVGMVVGLATYLAGRRWLPPEPAPIHKGGIVEPRPPLLPGEGRRIVVLVALLPVLALASVGNEQMFNAYLLWGEANYRLVFFGRTMPVTWLISITSVFAILGVAGTIAFWRWWATRWREPDEMTKLLIGTLICMLAPLILAAASLYAAGGHKISLGWAVIFHLVNEVGFASVYPVGMALYSRCAPRAIGSTMVALYYLHLFASNMLVGRLGGLLETMSPANFWLMHAGLIAIAAAILLVFRKLGGRLLAPIV
ncbi:peptide MFS transporter [Sphingomonas nostoxanthinifaciens]|uniref:peptide MFS transporter n=1 Tax=Sphingomonas nostoxanthinifaciens TaxID=2872652 RepID=UPI001CC2008F|nr:oligopeptide:H+ symporter [Sphingomonas nostoxanthinifaciens]UAK23483.1 oligopeptide:H+ symporter [Sphingomonas nostoxanthinifaciens]